MSNINIIHQCNNIEYKSIENTCCFSFEVIHVLRHQCMHNVPRVRANAYHTLTTPPRVFRDLKMCLRNIWTAPKANTTELHPKVRQTCCPLFYLYILCIWISGLQSVFHSEKLIVKVTLVTLSILEKRHRQSSPDI